jgi:sulfur carrier protein
MEIYVNGKAREVPEGYTAMALLEALGTVGRRVAMEVNREIVPRSEYEHHVFNPGDRVEVVQAIGGG